MKSDIKIAVIGGTGKSGKYLVAQLLEQGFQIKLLLRNPVHSPALHPLIEIVPGDVANYADVLTLVKDCHAVISTLGLGNPPSTPTIFSQSTSYVLQAMEEYKVRRYILVTGLNVDTSFDKKGAKTAQATEWMKSTYPISTANKQLEYELLAKSKVDWTLVRLPMIELTEELAQIQISLEDCPGDKISATSLAYFLVAQLSDNTFRWKSPFIANK